MRRAVAVALLATLASLTFASTASAHAELRQASPDVDQTVGGTVHQVAIQFIGLDPDATHDTKLFDPAGNQIEAKVIHEGQRIVLPITEPFTIPGEYLVTYAVYGIDGDFTESEFTFRYDESAPEPVGITVPVYQEPGFDFVTLAMLIAGATIAAFMVHRFVFAWREHKAAQQASLTP